MIHPLATEPQIWRFRHASVRHLAWVIASPPIISGRINRVSWMSAADCLSAWQRCLPALMDLDQDPTPLLLQLEQVRSHRLGFYFESLVAFWLKLDPRYHLLANNLPLRDQYRTVGELDFIVEDLHSNQLIHLEVAVKFYLCRGAVDNMADWWGASQRDQLAAKFRHLSTHQTQLSLTCPELVPYAVTHRACLLKGRLFYPATATDHCRFADSGHLHGRWQTLSQFRQTHAKVYVLTKHNWLMPPTRLSQATELKPENLPQQVITCTNSQTGNFNYWFVLPD